MAAKRKGSVKKTAAGTSFEILIGSDADVERIVTAICENYDYQPEVADPDNPGETIPNPQPPDEFARQCAIRWVIENVAAREVRVAAAQASAAAAEQTPPAVN